MKGKRTMSLLTPRKASLMWLLPLLFIAIGCDQSAKTVADLQNSLSVLTQNKSLCEQFVRDVKANSNPADPAYAQVMDSYQNARVAYDHFLDAAETDGRAATLRSMRGLETVDIQNATADFMADATSILKPALNTRRVPYQRLVVIPENLQAALKKLPKKDRERLIDKFDRQIRWKAWSEL